MPTEEEIDDAVERWHKGAGEGLELHEYLGWSVEEYSAWVRNPDAIPDRPLRK